MCYTSGTTGNPKGVAYSHRSAYLHSLAATTPAALNLSERDRILTIVPMFHANAWGIPYAAFMCGASLVMPGRFLQAEPLHAHGQGGARHVLGRGAHDLGRHLRYGEEHEIDLSSIRMIICGGSAVPRSLMERLRGAVRRAHRAGVGHDRDVAARRGRAPARVGRDRLAPRRWTGAAAPAGSSSGVELRIVDDTGQRRCRGTTRRSARSRCAARGSPASYFGDPSPEKFDDGWLRTGDVGSCQPAGLRADHRPGQGRDQVGRRVDQLGRAREPSSWPIPTWSRRA